LREMERQTAIFRGVFGRAAMFFHMNADGSPARVYGEIVSSGYFQTLGVNAIVGRTLTSEDNGPEDASPVCVITWRLWQGKICGGSCHLRPCHRTRCPRLPDCRRAPTRLPWHRTSGPARHLRPHVDDRSFHGNEARQDRMDVVSDHGTPAARGYECTGRRH